MMTPLQIVVVLAIGVILFKGIASLMGRGDMPILNVSVTLILLAFLGVEVFNLVQAFLSRV